MYTRAYDTGDTRDVSAQVAPRRAIASWRILASPSYHHGALGSRHSTHTLGSKFAPCVPYPKPSTPRPTVHCAIVDVVQEILAPVGRFPLFDRSEDSRLLTQGTPDHGGPAICLLEGGSSRTPPSCTRLMPLLDLSRLQDARPLVMAHPPQPGAQDVRVSADTLPARHTES